MKHFTLTGIIFVLMAALFLAGAQQKEYVASNPAELQTALSLAKGGDIVYVNGTWSATLQFGKLKYPDETPLVIDGQNKTKLLKGLSVMDCHNLTVQNMDVTGSNGSAGVDINDSYPDIGIKNVTFKGLNIHDVGPRGIFMGGHNIDGVCIIGCTITRIIDGTHGIYLTGGHWKPEYPAIRNIRIENCDVSYIIAGRNDIQLNGRFDGVVILNNRVRHAQLNGFTLIGCQNVLVEENEVYGCNRGTGLVIYDYASHWAPYYNYFETPEDIAAFCATHHPCQNIMARKNTFVVGPTRYSVDAYHSDDPTANHPAILINNAVHSGFMFYVAGEATAIDRSKIDYLEPPEPDWDAMKLGRVFGDDYIYKQFDFPPKNIVIKDNILVGPSENLLDIYNAAEAVETALVGNMTWVLDGTTPCIHGATKLKYVAGNIVVDPEFKTAAQYDFVNLIKTPGYDWREHKTKFNGLSWPGKQAKKGRTYKVNSGIWTRKAD